MNYYPGTGLLIGTAVLGNTVGRAYPAGTPIELCKLYGTLLTVEAAPPGYETTEVKNFSGEIITPAQWVGVKVTASLSVAENHSAHIIGTNQVDAVTNEAGYFEIYVVKGLTCTVTCPSFGKKLTIDTTGLTSLDLSTLFV